MIIGYVTNLLAIKMIFEPVEPRQIGPFKLHGLFLRRQPEVAEVYGEIIADDIVTIGNIGDELLNGPRSDRTRQMIETAMRPAIDRAVGPARTAVRVAVGTDALRHDPRVGRHRGGRVHDDPADRRGVQPPPERGGPTS